MKTSSAKAKGRRLQQWVRTKLIELLSVDPEDIESRPMGSSGEDLIMGVQTKKLFPYSVECKNQEAVNVWKAYEQCSSNTSPNVESLVIIKRNKSKPLALVDAEYFINLHKQDGWIKNIHNYFPWRD